jgi:amino acid adenylation domain-containing protein
VSVVDYNPFSGPPIAAVLPMTRSQSELWMAAQQSDHASCAYNLSISVSLDGALDVPALRAAMQRLVRRHESLRLSFAGESMSMCIAESMQVDIPVIDLSDEAAELQDTRISGFKEREVSSPFDLVFGPLLRAMLIRQSESKALLLLTFHHLIADGWTVDLLVKELAELYSSEVEERPPELPPAYQISSYASWLNEVLATSRADDVEKFWIEKFQHKAPALELPVDRPRPSIREFHAARIEVDIKGDEAQQIFTAASGLKSTFFIFAFASYVAFLHRITGQDDFVVAVPAAGQLDVGENALAGHCVNALPMRCHPDGSMSFAEHLQSCRDNVYESQSHTPFTYGNLMGRVPLDRDLSRPLLASTLLTVDQEIHDLDFSGIKSRYDVIPREFENFDLQVALVVQDDHIQIQCQYNIGIFDAETALARMEEFAALMKAAAADPQASVSSLPIFSDQERALFETWNDTAVEYRRNCTLHGLFEEQVDRTPDRVALEFEGQTLTYREFDDRCNQLAHHLKTLGVGQGDLVGVCMNRSFEMLISLYAILKAGGAYVPFDPEYPPDRLQFILQDTAAKVVLAQEAVAELLPAGQTEIFCVDSQWSEIDQLSTEFVSDNTDETSLAYVIYTSGSTGRPKGVMNEHRGICNQLFWMQEKFAVDGTDNILLKTAYSFDVSIWELFYPLLNGARLVIAPPEAHQDPDELSRVMRESNITATCFVPSTLAVFLGTEGVAPEKLRWIITIGEALTPDLQARFLTQMPGVELHNLYGPTEAAVAVTHWLCNESQVERTVPIGRPFANVQIHILDKNLKPVPVGVSGELWIGGIQVARGYLNRDELTEATFVSDPFSDDPEARIYRTGDLARWNKDGVIEYIGRVDFQVKVRGLRIELGEIESVLEEHALIENSVVVVNEPRPGDQRIVAHFTATAAVGSKELRKHLGNKLPQYMIPQSFEMVSEFPLTPSGKIDRKKLKPVVTAAKAGVRSGPEEMSKTETSLSEIWRSVIGGEQPGRHDNFFEIGGHSLLAVKALNETKDVFGVSVPTHMIALEELGEIARFIEQQIGTVPKRSFLGSVVESIKRALQVKVAPDAS